ncbi:general odorant-binding protein 45-like [Toxorhynchites rutilus septentrionalis]|uniref:general odorant-binding protein 45-like n=1 Tax=Toxorhynchites rutilus septentrionalis TaxID=329112 RepID=UPI002479FB19|nr:general odorant-binding protein 45-like [Toxorhynchites rutilus septentrionalis]
MWAVAAVFLIPIAVAVVSEAPAEFPHSVVYKSFSTALSECAEYFQVPNCTLDRYIQDSYPNNDDVKRLIRCVLINLNGWSDEAGVRENVLGNFFQPLTDDKCYSNRTKECIKRAYEDLEQDDHYSRAYESFYCYYTQHGNLVQSDQFIPSEPYELKQLVLTGLLMANLPKQVLVKYSKGDILNDSYFPSILLLFCVRGGYYSIYSGIQLKNIYTQLGYPELLSPEVQQCCGKVSQSLRNADHATHLIKMMKKCLKYNLTMIAALFEKGAKALIGAKSSPAYKEEQSSVRSGKFYNRVFVD